MQSESNWAHLDVKRNEFRVEQHCHCTCLRFFLTASASLMVLRCWISSLAAASSGGGEDDDADDVVAVEDIADVVVAGRSSYVIRKLF